MITHATTFTAVARLACSRAGWPYGTVTDQSLTTEQWNFLREEISAALEWAWNAYWWEDCLYTCQVTLRDDYAAGTTYAALDEVYDPDSDAYYICLQASTGNAPASWDGTDWLTDTTYWARVDDDPDLGDYEQGDWVDGTAYVEGDRVTWHGDTWACILAHTADADTILPSNATYWGKVPDFEYSIPYAGEDAGGTARPVIGRMQKACPVDPRANLAAAEFETENTASGVRFFNLTVTRPWITYRVRCPELTGDAWSASATYTTEDEDRAVWGL